jgi:hypothetical protein
LIVVRLRYKTIIWSLFGTALMFLAAYLHSRICGIRFPPDWIWVSAGAFIAGMSIWIGAILIESPGLFAIKHLLITCAFIVVAFGCLYFGLSMDPVHFTGHSSETVYDFIYFSIVTFATVGFGDIVPQSILAKLLVITQIVTEFVYIVVFFTSVTRTQWRTKDRSGRIR